MDIVKLQQKLIKVAVLIPSCNDSEEIGKCLKSLEYTFMPANVKMDTFVLKNDYEGYAVTVNKGIQACKDYDYIALLNDDVEVVPGWLTTFLVSFADADRNNKNIAAVVDANGMKPNNIVFFCSLIKREVFEKVGSFDERFHPAYVEDVDFCCRCRDAGYEFAAVGVELCNHKIQATFGKNPKKEELIAANWVRFKEKWKGTKHENFKEEQDVLYAKLMEKRKLQPKMEEY